MTADKLRFLVVRRGVDEGIPWAAGDPVTTYELVEPWPYAELSAHGGHDHALVAYMEAVGVEMGSADPAELWREDSALYCSCTARRKLVTVVVHRKSGRRWVSPRRDRKAQRPPDFWPLHGREGEGPHYGDVSQCNGCNARWLVISFSDHAELIGIKSVRYGAEVAG
jgi:hypothetical protein